jgi:predicted cobalt transporter CbtA
MTDRWFWWWLFTMALTVLGTALMALGHTWWAGGLLLLAWLSCFADAGWRLWE